ncbi:CpaF family protein [Microbacterium sp. MPKO10]|uniref:CpaF family protein n=1 Tax=Microbacterium sp. MPKO10 TaxID=2989818 RepID=UPI002235A4B4|nr:ATPase, T2SS/T4P/T4SS family [Microbacterium sp. MPKO10]MCW4458139.1 ATPase, T2SS/T4P/T4SS family [Microbacterium sp. MPKO10]
MTTSAVDIIAEAVRERVRREGTDLANHAELTERYVSDELRRYSEQALAGTGQLIDDERAAARQIIATLTGLGPLQAFLDDPEIEEIWINSPTRVFVARGGDPELTDVMLTETGVRDLVERMLQATGRRVDVSSPFVDASLDDGSRLHVVIPDVTRRHMAVNIRKFTHRIRTLEDLVAREALSEEASEFLSTSVRAGCNILVSGATQAGKTTLLGALLNAVSQSERIITVEETFELDVTAADAVGLQCRQPSLEGTGEITLRRLIKESLRMRPDRIVVGEVREAESLDLLIALNSGVPGACTVHANSATDALRKLCLLPLLAGANIDSAFVVPTVASCVDLVVHCARDAAGVRRIVEIAAPTGRSHDGQLEATTIYRRTAHGLGATGAIPEQTDKYVAAGIDVAELVTRGAS